MAYLSRPRRDGCGTAVSLWAESVAGQLFPKPFLGEANPYCRS